MKKIVTFLGTIAIWTLLTAGLFQPQQACAQTPEKMSYQAVIRDSDDNLIVNTSVGMQISILEGSASGTEVYVERQFPTTNNNGLVSIEIGSSDATVVSGDFTTIDWSTGIYFIKSETDLNGGSSYTITGTSQLLSVPYALHAKSADTVSGEIAETDPSVPTGKQIGEMQYWDGKKWVTISAGNEGQVLIFESGVPIWKTPGVVENPTTGKIWMDRNLGALRVAASSTDADAYGDLYQWGRAGDGHQLRTTDTTRTTSSSDTPFYGVFITVNSNPYDWRSPQNDTLWQGVNGTNNPCPGGYRLPTEAEWEAERTSWSSNDAAGAFASPLKLSMAGGRSCSSGLLVYVGSNGGYWSSTVSDIFSRRLGFNSSTAKMYSNQRAYGFSVRCLKD